MDKIATNTGTSTKDTAVTSILFLIGCAILVTNVALILFFSKQRKAIWTTYLFLTNLALSDVLMGLVIAIISPSWLFMEKQWPRLGCTMFALGTVSMQMSAYTILILSAQVSHIMLILWVTGIGYILVGVPYPRSEKNALEDFCALDRWEA